MSGGQGERPLSVRWSVDAIRPEDLFVARIEFVRMVRQVRKTPLGHMRATVEPDASDESSIVLHLQGQNIGERAFFETVDKLPVDRPAGAARDPDTDRAGETPSPASIPVATRLAGPSRLVFRVPKGAPPIGFSIAEILDACRGLALRLAPTALPPRSAGIQAFQPAWVITFHLAYFIWCMFGQEAAFGPKPLWLLRIEVVVPPGARPDWPHNMPIHLGLRV